jgi:hypothetical protein
MRIRTLLACITIAVGAAGCGRRAEESRAGASPDISTAALPGSFPAEVVMVDPGKHRIVLSTAGASGAGISVRERSLPVSDSATAMLSGLKARDQVVVACADNAASPSAGPASAPPAPSSSASSSSLPRDIGPAGGNDGIGPIATGDELATCTTVVSVTRVATPLQ